MASTIFTEPARGLASILLASVIGGVGIVPCWAFECAVLGVNDILQVCWQIWSKLVNGACGNVSSSINAAAALANSRARDDLVVEEFTVKLTLGDSSAFSGRCETGLTEGSCHGGSGTLVALVGSDDLV